MSVLVALVTSDVKNGAKRTYSENKQVMMAMGYQKCTLKYTC